jgi:hypothetical protein
MLAILAAVMAALSLLLQWLSFRKQKHGTLTADQKIRLNHALAQMEKVKALAASFGCSPQDDPLQTVIYNNEDLFGCSEDVNLR